MSEDITFCAFKCENKTCDRNQVNIKHPELDHSFAYFDECPIAKKRGQSHE